MYVPIPACGFSNPLGIYHACWQRSLIRPYSFQRRTSRTPSPSPPTDYGAFVLAALARHTETSGSIDQRALRQCLALASSYLITDTTMNPDHGHSNWSTGFSRLIDVLVVLHKRGELELDTFNAASRACSECWTVAGSWREMDAGRESVRGVAARLRGLLDENGKTYRGGRVYIP